MKYSKDINAGIKAFKNEKNALLLDVRTEEEYVAGHIEGSLNIPVQKLNEIITAVKNFSTPLYVYCHSGVRSAKAVKELKKMGYDCVKDIGGIKDYKEEVKNI